MMANPHKTSHCSEKTITVYYTDSKQRFTLPYAPAHIQEIQLHGNNFEGKTYQDKAPSLVFETDVFSPYQRRLYKEALHGLSIYSEEEIESMSFQHRRKIEIIHRRTQRILNEWRQSIVSKAVDDLLLTLFHKSAFVKKHIVERTKHYTTNSLINYQSFAELQISNIDIAKKLVERGILPPVFFKLKTAA